MYGLLIESLAEYLRTNYGDDTWEAVRRASNLPHATFNTHSVYPENTIPMIVEAASEVLGVSIKELMENLGVFFVCFVGRYGYDRVLSVLGRHMRDFLNGLDNLHEYLRFSYPRMRPPSFFCENENSKGLTLHYRTKRSGFLYYTMGQIKAVGQHYYNTPVEIELVSEEVIHGTLNVVFQLHFDNSGFDKQKVVVVHEEHFLPIRAHVFFDIFPFAIVFDSQLIVKVIGNSLHATMPDAVGRKFTDIFSLIRPLIEFTWPSILSRTNNIFELVSAEPIHHPVYEDIPEDNRALVDDIFGDQPHDKCLHLKGQMLYMEDWQGIIYLGTPVMPDLETMVQTGLYINDLSMHDFSRDLMLAGTQQSVELKLALDQEQQKTMKLEESMRKLDEEMKRTDELLYQMIPKAVADRLRNGEPAVGTCEVFDCVTILFSDVVTFTEICSRISPMEVVSLLNCMYSLFDRLTEKHGVYKVETIGDAYMVVSGAPERRDNHAVQVCDMALDMIEVITGLRDPSTGSSIRIRIGIHSGMVVAGVVGVKMPRYCLFGDTVNTASRMESNSEPMKIHISEASQHLIPGNLYTMKERGTIPIKGKGNMKTYWLESKSGYEPPSAKLGSSSSSNRGTVLYSPVMFGDSILSRNSLAYSVLSDYSCPRASAYSSVAKVGTRASISVDDWTRGSFFSLRANSKEGPSTPKEALGMGGNRGGTGQSGREVPFLRNRAYSSPGLQGDRRPLLADSGKLKDTSLPTVSLASGTHCTGNCKSSYCAVQ